MKRDFLILLIFSCVFILGATSCNFKNGWVDDGTTVRLETSTDRVGIGTPTPADKLHVFGGHIVVTGGKVGPRGIVFDHGQPGTTLILGTAADLQIRSGSGVRSIDFFGGPAVPLARITGDGNVGIGITAPQEKLQVAGRVKAHAFITGDITFQKNDQNLWRMFEDEDGLYIENLKSGKVYRFVLQEVK